jgi:hypothetical protein
MSGRNTQGHGRGLQGILSRGRGGSGRHDSNTSQSKGIIKKNLQDYQYYIGSAKQASDYEETTSYLINQIRKIYAYGNDIATALDQLQHVDLSSFKPALQSSQSKEEDVKALENEQFRLEFKILFDVYVKREQTYLMNMSKAYAFLWDQCSKAMQQKIELRQDYEKDIVNNPIKLMCAIKEHALNFQDKNIQWLSSWMPSESFHPRNRRKENPFKITQRGLKWQRMC